MIILLFLTLSWVAFDYTLDKEYIKQHLSQMVRIDQELRAKIDHSKIQESLMQEITKTNQENLQALKEILNNYYWITSSEFGEEADHNAWLLVQHADHDIEFQKEILVRLEQLLPAQETSAENYAYLYDRVAKNENRLQRYGTQGAIKDGKWMAYALEDSINLDYRRAQMGLSSFQEYIDTINRVFNLNQDSN